MVIDNTDVNAFARLRSQSIPDNRCCLVTKAKVVDCDVNRRFCLTDEIGDPGRNVSNLRGSLGRCREWIAALLLEKNCFNGSAGERCGLRRH